MTAEQLRNSILQEAISGRLVPQDPNDEPASVLLARIREEKARLVKEGKLKKKDLVETPIAEDEIPFDIPSSWVWGRLKFFCSRFSTGPFGTMVHKEDYVENNGHNLINPTNIKQRKIIADGIKQVSEAKYKELNSYVLAFNDLVLARRGDLSKIAIVSKKEEGWLAGTGAFFMHFYEGIYLPYFIYLYTSPFCQNYLLQQSVGGTMDNLNQKLLADFIFPLPPLAEQQRIVAKLEELLPIVEQYGKAQTELDELNAALPARLRQSILQQAISGRLVPQDPNDEPASVLLQRIREEKARLVKEGKLKKKDLVETPITEEEMPFEIPASWEWVRYQDIADCALGKTKNPNQVEGELCQYLCSINVYWDSVRLNVLKEMLFSDTDKQKYSVEKGDMLICEGGEAGRSAIYEGDISPIYYQNALHRVRFYGGICTRFFLYQMELYKKTGLLTDHIKGETIQHFVSTKLLNLPIPLPPLAEQKRIVAKIEELFEQIDKITK